MEVSYVCLLAVPDLGIGFFKKKFCIKLDTYKVRIMMELDFCKKNLGGSGGTKNEVFKVMTKI